MTIVVTYGTFDLIHVGHVRLLQRARMMGTSLAVGVSTDEFNRSKGKRAIVPFNERCEMLLELRSVDRVFAEESWDQKPADLVKLGADMLVMGSDWEGKFDDLRRICEVRYLPRTELISTTVLRERAAAESLLRSRQAVPPRFASAPKVDEGE